MDKERERLIIIDGNAIVHRAFHALPPLTNKKGELVNAIYGFLLFFFKSIKEFKPDYVAATFDYPAKTFRHRKYELYKAKRQKAPDNLYSQIPKIKEVLKNFGIAVFEKEGYEADDIIGAISHLAEIGNSEIETIILTGDNDTLQLVDGNTKVFALRRGVKDAVLYGEKETKEKYGGLNPNQLVDFRALRGDPSDNIPGVFGIGEKTAVELIKKFGAVENLYRALETKTEKTKNIKDSVKEKLLKNKENAYLSKMLSQIEKNVPIEFSLEKCHWKNYDKEKVRKVLNDYGFVSLIKQLDNNNEKSKLAEENQDAEKKGKIKKTERTMRLL